MRLLNKTELEILEGVSPAMLKRIAFIQQIEERYRETESKNMNRKWKGGPSGATSRP